MRVLVTGGAGYVGSHAVLALAEAGHDVALIDSFVNASRDVVARLEVLTGRPIVAFDGDVRDPARLDVVLCATRPGCVVHFAGLKAVVESQQNPLAYYDTNVQGTIALLKAMDRRGCGRLVFSSSAVVYGAAQYLPIDEAHPVAPANPYGRTKLFAERIIEDWVAATRGASAVILRYFNPVGAHGSGLIGEAPIGDASNLMPIVMQVARGVRSKLSIYGCDWPTRDGTGLRDFIHVVDLAEAHAAAITYAAATAGASVFNVGTGRGATVLELVAAVQRATGRTVPVSLEPRRANDIGASVADPTRAATLMRWRASRGLDEMCRSAWLWQRRLAGAAMDDGQPAVAPRRRVASADRTAVRVG